MQNGTDGAKRTHNSFQLPLAKWQQQWQTHASCAKNLACACCGAFSGQSHASRAFQIIGWRTDTHTHTHLADNYHVGSITRQWAASPSLLALPKILTQRLRGSAIPGLPFAAKLPNLFIRWQTPQDPKRGERRENYEEGRSQRKAQNHTKGVP